MKKLLLILFSIVIFSSVIQSVPANSGSFDGFTDYIDLRTCEGGFPRTVYFVEATWTWNRIECGNAPYFIYPADTPYMYSDGCSTCLYYWGITNDDTGYVGTYHTYSSGIIEFTNLNQYVTLTGAINNVVCDGPPNWFSNVPGNQASKTFQNIGCAPVNQSTNYQGKSCNSDKVDDNSFVNYTSGNLFQSHTLLNILGKGQNINFSLYYNNLFYNNNDTSISGLSQGWTHTYAMHISSDNNGLIELMEEDNRRVTFQEGSIGFYNPVDKSNRLGTTLQKPGDGTYLLSRKGGNKYVFNNAGKLARIEDRIGNALTLTYSDNVLTSIMDASGRMVSLEYDAQQRLAQVTDPAGRVISLGYDVNGDLNKIIDPAGQEKSFTYVGNHQMTSRRDPNGNVIQYGYDTMGRLWSTSDPSITSTVDYFPESFQSTVTEQPSGNTTTTVYDPELDLPIQTISSDNGVTSRTYDTNGNLLSVTDPAGNVTSYMYDSRGNRTSGADALGHLTTYTYNALDQVTTITDPEGHITTYIYDSSGNLTSITDPGGAVTQYQYDAAGNLTAVIRPGGHTTTFVYDSYGNPVSTTDPVGLTTTYTYDLVGNMTSRTDANGATTMFVYDNVNRLLRVTHPTGNVTTFTYDANGNRRTVTDANGRTTTIDYNDRNKPIRMTDPLGNVTTYDYTVGGCSSCGATGGDLLASVTDPNWQVTSYEYDLSGRMTIMTDPLWNQTSYTYDAVGNPLSKTDAEGRLTVFAYDPLRRLTSRTDPLQGVTSYGYTPAGRTASVTDAAGNSTTYAYENTGRVISTFSPDTGTTAYTYNPDGTFASKTDADGTTVTYAYDNAARLTGIAFPNAAENVTYSYDSPSVSFGKGRLTGMTDPSGMTTYRYDALGRITREERVVLGVPYSTSYAYDNVGNLLSITYPSGRVVNYGYDAGNHPTSVSMTQGSTTTPLASGFAYDPAGNLLSFASGNGLVSSRTYDPANRVETIDVPGVAALSYAYDMVGNILSIADGVDPASSKTFVYDFLNRLTQATGPWNTLAWTYDGNGNRLSQQNGTTTTYTYQANRLMTVTDGGVATYQYDLAGNVTGDGTKTFVYNQNQRLIRVLDGSSVLGEYTYDGKGRRGIKQTYTTTATTVFHYDRQGRLIEETDEGGNLLADYVYLGEKPLAMVKKALSEEEVYYFHNDHLGVPAKVTDKTGAVDWDVLFDPFGNVAGGSLWNVENNLRFPGQYFDAETGLHQNYFRDYDPRTGSYIEPDPIGLAGGMNLYLYSKANPIRYIDRLGLDTWSGAGDEVGGFLAFAGTSTMYGFVTNWRTGEKCYIETTCYKLGAGIAGGVTAQSIWIPSGPKLGKGLAGSSTGMGVEGGFGGYVSGTPAGTGSVSKDGTISVTGGAGIGAGFAEYAQQCTTRVISCEDTPKQCGNN